MNSKGMVAVHIITKNGRNDNSTWEHAMRILALHVAPPAEKMVAVVGVGMHAGVNYIVEEIQNFFKAPIKK